MPYCYSTKSKFPGLVDSWFSREWPDSSFYTWLSLSYSYLSGSCQFLYPLFSSTLWFIPLSLLEWLSPFLLDEMPPFFKALFIHSFNTVIESLLCAHCYRCWAYRREIVNRIDTQLLRDLPSKGKDMLNKYKQKKNTLSQIKISALEEKESAVRGGRGGGGGPQFRSRVLAWQESWGPGPSQGEEEGKSLSACSLRLQRLFIWQSLLRH